MSFRPAATLILIRPAATPSGFEVAMLHRNPALRFLGNFWVFPGGRADRGESPAAAAVRETFEETGHLLVPGAEALDPASLEPHRRTVLADSKAFAPALEALGVAPDWTRARPCGRWKTPPFGPVRFDTSFFLAVVPGDTELSCIPGEIDRIEWADPQATVARWRADEALLAPPTRHTLQALAASAGDPTGEGWAEATAERVAACHPEDGEWGGVIDFRPGIRLVLLRTPTLPPATHTNCVVVGDGDEAVVIDPASPYPDEQERLAGLLADLAEAGTRVREVILTHHHPDHVGGAKALADRLGVPIAAHATTRDLLQGRLDVTRLIADGDTIELPTNGDASRARRLRAHLLEGHADGHLVFVEETTRSVIAGDMVAGVGTIVIDPPEGKMALYLDSLRRLKELDGVLLYPSHGPPIGDPAKYVDFYVNHRLEREAKVLAALADGPATVPELVPRAYDDKPAKVYPYAQRAALAHLLKLEDEGRVVRADGERWAQA